mgnify:CR=1 FL=1
MSITVIPLKINLLTNFQDDKIIFEKSFLTRSNKEVNDTLNDSDLNKYPFICLEYAYPSDMFSSKKYYEILEIIFNENRLISYLSSLKPEKLSSKNVHITNSSITQNVMITLTSIFPTSFPVVDDISNSIDHVLGSKTLGYFNYDTGSRMIGNMYRGREFSYLNVNGNDYTFTKLIYLNDILNHPIYFNVLKQYNKYYNYIKDAFFTNENRNYDTSIKVISDGLDNLLMNVFLKIFKVISDDKVLNSKFNSKPIILNPIKQIITSLFFLKHAILRINIDYGTNIVGFKQKIENYLTVAIFPKIKNENIKKAITDLLEQYKGEIYYPSSHTDYNSGYNIDIENNKLENFNPDIKLSLPLTDSEKNYFNSSGKILATIDEIYNTSNSDEHGNLVNKIRNSKIFFSHFWSVAKIINGTSLNATDRKVTSDIKIPYSNFYQDLDKLFSFDNKSELYKFYENTKNFVYKSSAIEKPSNKLNNYLQEKNIGKQLDTRYTEKWNDYKNRFIEGTRSTTNEYLQELLQNETLKSIIVDESSLNCMKISDIFTRIYNRFIAIEGTNILRSIDDNCNNIANVCMNTGVSIIKEFNQNSTDEYSEIYVICDFINGKINDENLKDMKCGYYDKQLGYLINNIYYKDNYSDSKVWDLNYNRNKINIQNKEESQNSDNEQKIQDINRVSNETINSPDNNQLLLRAKMKFNNFVSQNSIITNELVKYNNTAMKNIDDNNLFDNINKYYPNLLKLIVKWSNNDYYKTPEKRKNLEIYKEQIKSGLESAIKVKEIEAQGKYITEQEKKRFLAIINLYKLFNVILNQIVEDLDKPSINNTNNIEGGRRSKTKKRKRKNNKTKKRKY